MEKFEKINIFYIKFFELYDKIKDKKLEIKELEEEINSFSESNDEETKDYINDLETDIDNLSTSIDWMIDEKSMVFKEIEDIINGDKELEEQFKKYWTWRSQVNK